MDVDSERRAHLLDAVARLCELFANSGHDFDEQSLSETNQQSLCNAGGSGELEVNERT